MLPDLISEFTEIDLNRTLSDDAERSEEKPKRAGSIATRRAERIHNISQLLRAYCLYEKDVQYVVEEDKVVIVDEYTGRKMPGRRWSDGLHQAVEAKEGVQIDRETQTLATITIQNYFRLYQKLAGMTGTAETEANEFHDIYKLDVAVIPTNRPVARKDANDRIYKTRREKYNAVINEITERHAQGAAGPGRHGERRGVRAARRMLKREKIPHNVLNAKYHQQEAEIVARAGQRGHRHDLDEHGRPRHRHQARRRRAGQRRPVRHRHRAPRIAPHRPPVARPLRAPGRSGRDRVSSSASRTISCATSARPIA